MEPERETDAIGIDFFLRVLRRRWPVVVACVVLGVAGAVALSLSQPKKYSASATLLFEDSDLDQALLTAPTTGRQDPVRAAATNNALVSLGIVEKLTERALPGVDVDVEVSESDETNLSTVTATSRDPRAAAKVATTFATEFIGFRQRASRAAVDRAISLLEGRVERLRAEDEGSTEIEALESRLESLQNYASVQTGNVQLVQPAEIPDAPSSPRTKRNIALGLFLGLLLGLVLAFAIDRLDRRIRDPREIEDVLGVPILGMVPQSSTFSHQRGGLEQLRPIEVEPFRLLRAELRYFGAGGTSSSCVLIQSAGPGEGKSTVAWNLSLISADAGARVLLIEADLRRPTLGLRSLDHGRGVGLSSVLSGQATFEDAIHSQELPNGVSVDVLFAGPKPPNPADLLDSEAMNRLIAEARERYETVIIDSAPIPVVSDAIPLLREVDGVLVVTRLRQTRRDALEAFQRQLSRLKAPVLGVVINGGTRGGEYTQYGAYGVYEADVADNREVLTAGPRS